MSEFSISKADLWPILEKLDAELAAEGTPIPGRAMRACLEFSKRNNLGVTIRFDREACPEPFRGSYISIAIFDFFDQKYGDRQSLTHGRGRSVVLLSGDVFRFDVPIIYGSARMVCDTRAFWEGREPPALSKTGPVDINVLFLIENLTVAHAKSLSRENLSVMLQDISKRLKLHHQISIALASHQYNLLTDLWDAAEKIYSGHYGQSRYHSQQSCEKFLKAFIASHGSVREIHDLHKLNAQAGRHGLPGVARNLLNVANTSSRVKYGEVASTRSQAFEAYDAALEICCHVSAHLR